MLGGNGNARSVRIDPDNANPQQFPSMVNDEPDKAMKKIESIKDGADLQRMNPVFQPRRKCQDVVWVVLFFVTVFGVLGTCYFYAGSIEENATEAGSSKTEVVTEEKNEVATEVVTDEVATESQPIEQADTETADPDDVNIAIPNMWTLVVSGTVGALAAIVTSFILVIVAHQAPTCVVYTTLFFGPGLAVIMGMVLLGFAGAVSEATAKAVCMIFGIILIMLGVCLGFCTWCCYRHLIPFMIKLTETVADVIDDHFCLLGVALFGAVLSCLWTMACFIAFIGVALEHEVYKDDGKSKFFGFCCVLIFTWGSQVCTNICHVTYSGVFGRWYFGFDKTESPLAPSFKVAMVTSLGSICKGSFLVAAIRAIEYVVNQMKRQAQEDGNFVMCIILCCIECLVSMIGDMVEYFNEWAYVQCAFRGTKFCDSARITYSMMTCANIQFIICDLLLGSMSGLGALVCAAVGGGVGAGMGYVMDGMIAAIWGAILGCVAGFIAGAAAMATITSGIKAILAAWAENPQPLMMSHPDIHEEFEARINMKMAGEGMMH